MLLSGVPCLVPGPNPGPVCFRQLPEVGETGNLTATPSFLGVTTIPPGEMGFNCSEMVGAVSHFCSVILP